MIFVKIHSILYPAMVSGAMADPNWDNRHSKAIKLEMDYTTASTLFVTGLAWSIVERNEVGGQIVENEYDNSEFNLAGDITDHRDGTITVKMGKLTDLEQAYRMIYGGN